jgi:chromate reductase
MPYKIALIIGSLRKAAYTRLLANAVRELAPPTLEFFEAGIGELPLYNQDLETATPPQLWKTFRDQIRQADALLFITPEYNRGMPGALKNAVDVGSRPPKENVWTAKPAAVISLTPGALGAMAANIQLRSALSVVNAYTMPSPEAYIGGAKALFDETGKLHKEDTREFIAKILKDFETWIGRLKR